jgi:ABC-type multidrug transport system, ATPase component
MQAALRIDNLSKSFGKPAVDQLSLTINAGEFYALLGPNGAGKTTCLRMVAGLLQPDSGRIEIFGHDIAKDPRAAKQIVAWLPDEPMLYEKLTAWEYLDFIAGLWRLDRKKAKAQAEELLVRLALIDQRDQLCEGFSRGMRQKTALAGALLIEPKLLMLDEPLTGLDVEIARTVKDLLVERVRAGATIILTTHILEVAERLASRIGIIAKGRLRAEGTISDLRAQSGMAGGVLEDVFLDLIADKAPA